MKKAGVNPVSARPDWRSPKFPDSEQALKIRLLLRVGGLSCLSMGLIWASGYAYVWHLPLVALFLLLALIGVYLLCTLNQATIWRYAVAMHVMFATLWLISMSDAPIAQVQRTAHFYFLPLAVGGMLVFQRQGPYLRTFVPLLCMASFGVLSVACVVVQDFVNPLPDAVRELGQVLNVAGACSILVWILSIYREDVHRQMAMTRVLAGAVRNGQIQVVYQPQVRAGGRYAGVEALVRWAHPRHGLLSPDRFIPLAEETGLIHEIGLEVLRQACVQLRSWQDDPLRVETTISVNVSPTQFLNPGFVAAVREVIAQTGADPKRLVLEVTESAASTDLGSVRESMLALQADGITWALDDFGAGFSSLSRLNALPISQLKVDRQFVRQLESSSAARELLRKIIEISALMRLTTVIEGIETATQYQIVLGLGGRQFQGYLFGRPQSAAAVSRWMLSDCPHASAVPAGMSLSATDI